MSGSSKQKEETPAAAVQAEDPMHDASLADLEDEITDGPAANWEVAYVWAFLDRFTNLVDHDAMNPVMPNVMAFEQALVNSSPPASAFAAAANGDAVAPTRSSARLEEKDRTPPLTAVAIRAAKLANGAAEAIASGNGNGPEAAGAGANGRKGDGSPASSLSSLTASESGGDAQAAPHDEAAFAAAIKAVQSASVEPIDPIPPLLPAETPCPPSSDLLKDIVEVFIDNLKPIKELSEYHGKKTWFHFLINFVTYRFNGDPVRRGGFRWETNLLRTRGLKPGQEKEAKWWMLRWEDKIHLLRQMVDFQLTSSPAVRDLIKEQYDIGNQRNARRDPELNGLVLLPAGQTSSQVTLYHLDSSPRLYACGNLYKDDSPWIAVSSTYKGYKAFLKTLAEPTKAERKALGLVESSTAPNGPAGAAAAAAGAKGPFAKAAAAAKGKGKAKVEPGEDYTKEERMARARLEADFREMATYEKHMAAYENRQMRAAERAARTYERSINVAPTTTRSSRLRARLNYDEDRLDSASVASGSGGGAGGDVDEYDDGGSRRKRRRVDDGAGSVNGDGTSAAPSEAGSDVGGSAAVRAGSRRASGRQAPPPSIPGERRSSRLQQPAYELEAEPEVEAQAEPVASAAAATPDAQPQPEPKEEEATADAGEAGTAAAPIPVPPEGLTIPGTPKEPVLLKESAGEKEKKQEEVVEVKPMEGVESASNAES